MKNIILLLLMFTSVSAQNTVFEDINVIHQDKRVSIFTETKGNKTILNVVEFLENQEFTVRVAKYEVLNNIHQNGVITMYLGAKQYLKFTYDEKEGELCELTRSGLRCLNWKP